MAYTNGCDLYGGFDEGAISVILDAAFRQRPTLFNYATKRIIADPTLLCVPLPSVPVGTPAITQLEELSLPGLGNQVKLDYCFQITKVLFDLYPTTKKLPLELGTLKENSMLLELAVSVGAYLPEKLPLEVLHIAGDDSCTSRIVAANGMISFSLQIFAVANLEFIKKQSGYYLLPVVKQVEVVDILPSGLEDIIEKLSVLLLNGSILPGLAISLPVIALEFNKEMPINVKLKPSTKSPNPSIVDNRINAFLLTEV